MTLMIALGVFRFLCSEGGGDLVPMVAKRLGLPVEVDYAITLVYIGQFFVFVSTPLVFYFSVSVGVGRSYAGTLFSGVCAGSAYPFLVRLSASGSNTSIGICWVLWFLSFLLASAAFLIPLLYSNYLADDCRLTANPLA